MYGLPDGIANSDPIASRAGEILKFQVSKIVTKFNKSTPLERGLHDCRVFN
jgi:hypothetical protein